MLVQHYIIYLVIQNSHGKLINRFLQLDLMVFLLRYLHVIIHLE